MMPFAFYHQMTRKNEMKPLEWQSRTVGSAAVAAVVVVDTTVAVEMDVVLATTMQWPEQMPRNDSY
jgi:hypothetical protein